MVKIRIGATVAQLCGTAVVGLALLFPRTWARLVGTPGNAGDAKRRPTNRKPSAPEASLASLAPSIVGSDQELVCPDGILNWRLSDYGRAKRKERHGQHRYTTSPRFYTAEPGYLMQLRVHLHGLGHKGKFVAVQLVLHRGRHDNQLPWPFRHRLSVTLMDQTGGGRSVGYTIHDPCFLRPQGDHTTPYVWQEFVSQRDLEDQLLFQDSLLFRVVVEP